MKGLKKSGGDFPVRQPVLLKAGIYGGVFSRYKPTFEAPNKFKAGQMEPYVGLGFLITHSANEKRLPRLTSTYKQMKQSIYFDPDGAKPSSNLFEFFAAILTDEHTPHELYEMDPDDYPELEELVGLPVMLMIEPGKPTDRGISYNNLKKILPASDTMAEVISEFMESAVFAVDEKTGVKYVKSPLPEYEDDEEEAAPAAAAPARGRRATATKAAPATVAKAKVKPAPAVEEEDDDDDLEIPF